MIRTGRKVGNTVYRQVGEEPSENDVFLGSFVDPEEADDVVELYNACSHYAKRASELYTENLDLKDQLREVTSQMEHFRSIANGLKDGPVMSHDEKVSVENAFDRGAQWARSKGTADRYTMNRDGILQVGVAAARLAEAQQTLNVAVKLLSEEPAPAGAFHDNTHPVGIDTATGGRRCYIANCGHTEPAVVTPEDVAAQAADESDDVPASERDSALEDCRCDETTGLCRVHDVGH